MKIKRGMEEGTLERRLNPRGLDHLPVTLPSAEEYFADYPLVIDSRALDDMPTRLDHSVFEGMQTMFPFRLFDAPTTTRVGQKRIPVTIHHPNPVAEAEMQKYLDRFKPRRNHH